MPDFRGLQCHWTASNRGAGGASSTCLPIPSVSYLTQSQREWRFPLQANACSWGSLGPNNSLSTGQKDVPYYQCPKPISQLSGFGPAWISEWVEFMSEIYSLMAVWLGVHFSTSLSSSIHIMICKIMKVLMTETWIIPTHLYLIICTFIFITSRDGLCQALSSFQNVSIPIPTCGAITHSSVGIGVIIQCSSHQQHS